MIGFEHLQVIESISELGSFRKASESLHKAQSAISYSVKLVEEYYEIKIFNRETYRPELTEDGKLILMKIKELLKQANDFDNYAKEIKGEVELELRIGVTALYPLEKITCLLHQFKKEFPQTNIHLNIEVLSGEKMLLNKQIDIALIENVTQVDKIEYVEFDSVKMPLLVARNHPVVKIKKVREKNLLKYPQIILKSTYENPHNFGVLADSLKWYVTDTSSKKTLIMEGLGWGRLPEHMVEKELVDGDLIRIDNDEKVMAKINVAKLKSKSLGPVAKRFWEYYVNLILS